MLSLVSRSNCSLDSFSIDHQSSSFFEPFAHPEPPHPDIAILLQNTPNLTTFASGYIATPEFIVTVHDGLRHLTSVKWKVEPDGLDILLELLDECIVQPSSSGQLPNSFYITCYDGDEFSSVRARYIENYEKYRENGIAIDVYDEYDDIRFVGISDITNGD